MTLFTFGNPSSETVLIQPVDEHDLQTMDREVNAIRELSGSDFCLIACKIDCWNADLSPWESPAVFGREGFGSGAPETLSGLLKLCSDRGRTYYLGGYSLAGLFSLWAATRTDRFRGVAAASPSVWFPGFTNYLKVNPVKCGAVCLSLGDKEERTKNPVMATVGERIRDVDRLLEQQGVEHVLEWNPGNHFQEAERRTAKAFAWLLGR